MGLSPYYPPGMTDEQARLSGRALRIHKARGRGVPFIRGAYWLCQCGTGSLLGNPPETCPTCAFPLAEYFGGGDE